jgi:hypothetical protein
MKLHSMVLALAATLVAGQAPAQPANPPAPLTAPLLGIGKDDFGRPIPFGVPPYYTPETPLGSGPYKAVMATEGSLPQHVLYYPANVPAAAGKLPVIAWGNGGCIHAGNRFRVFLTEIASHGFLVISAGTMGHVSLEVGPQENPVVRRPGDPPPPPATAPPANDPSAPWRAVRSNADHLRQAIDWAVAENSRPGSRFYGRLDVENVGVAGQSCGGGLALAVAGDPRVKTVGVFNSGSRLTIQPNQPNPGGGDPAAAIAQAKTRLDAVHSAVLILTGDERLDIAYQGGRETFGYLSKPPVFYAWQEGLQHIGTYSFPGGGSIGRIGSDWFKWRLRGDQEAGRMFTGANCTLCREPSWRVQKKNLY